MTASFVDSMTFGGRGETLPPPSTRKLARAMPATLPGPTSQEKRRCALGKHLTTWSLASEATLSGSGVTVADGNMARPLASTCAQIVALALAFSLGRVPDEIFAASVVIIPDTVNPQSEFSLYSAGWNVPKDTTHV